MRTEQRILAIVAQGLTIHIQQSPSRRLQNGLPGRRIPLATGRETRVDITCAFGQVAKLQRAAAIMTLYGAPVFSQPLQAGLPS